MSARRLAAVVAVAAVLAGCASPAPVALPGVTVQVLQYRSDVARHAVQLEVVNGSAHAVVVTAAVLAGAGWSPSPRWSDPDPAAIGAGATVDLPVSLGTPACGVRQRLSARLRLDDGTSRSVRVVDLHGTLATLHRQACFAARAARTATLGVRDFRPRGRGAELDLAVHGGPGIAAGITVVRVLPTTLLSPRGGAETWSVGRRFTRPGTVLLRVSPTRCDLHAVAEDKVGTVLPVGLRLPDGTTGTVEVVSPKPLKDRMLSWIVHACGTA